MPRSETAKHRGAQAAGLTVEGTAVARVERFRVVAATFEGVTRGRPRSPHGAATRERLIDAAVDLFGQRGFQAVRGRDVAKLAGTPLSAIPYHFTTMDALYRATLERVGKGLAEAMAPAARAAAAAQRSPLDARAGLAALQQALVEVIAASPKAQAGSRVLLREHLDPGQHFDVVYDGAVRSAVEAMATLIARASGRHPDEESVLIEAFARMGQVLIFRTVRSAILRRPDWATIGTEEAGRTGKVFCGLAKMAEPERPEKPWAMRRAWTRCHAMDSMASNFPR